MAIKNSISEYRDVIVTFDNGTDAQLAAPIDSYKAAYTLVERIEGEYFKDSSSVADLTDASVLVTGAVAHQIHVFTLTTVMASADYEFVYVETKPNADA